MLTPISFTLQNIHFLQQDFLGIRIVPGIFLWVVSFLGVSGLLLLLYFFGLGIQTFIFRFSFSSELINALFSLALGHIFFSTGIALLGSLSLFTSFGIIAYLTLVILITIRGIRKTKHKPHISFKTCKTFLYTVYQANKIGMIFLILFVLLAILKLLSPEIGVDAIFYHFDYPWEYLRIHSMMEYPKGTQIFLTTPQLGQMLNVVLLFFHLVPGLRILHFLFFLCVTFVLLGIGTDKKITSLSILPPLLFAASPTVIGVMGSGYMDMEWILCWLLAFYVISTQKLTTKSLIIAGVLFGGTLAAKIQALPFFLTCIAVIFLRSKTSRIRYISIFTAFSFLISSLWYIRSIIITGSPLFYYHAPQTLTDHINLVLQSISPAIVKMKFLGLLINYHPFIFISLCAAVLGAFARKSIKKMSGKLLFVLILFANYLFLPILYFSGRFLLFGYSGFSVISSEFSIKLMSEKWFTIPLWTITCIIFMYYFSNALMIVPYGLGWANTNTYLTRVLSQNNASYYDFDHAFSPFIKQNDVIGTFTINGFLYANFDHRDVAYIVHSKSSFDNFKKAGLTKLLIKHGDMQWFCKQWQLRNCTPDKYTFLVYYAPAQQYLYTLR